MAVKIPLAHDFICPWCWVGLLQARQLQREFPITYDWLAYELLPEDLEWPDYSAKRPDLRPPVPSRFDLQLAAERMTMPTVERPKKMRTHNAHEAVEYAKAEGNEDGFVEALYRAYWEQGREINDVEVLKEIAKPYVADLEAMAEAIRERRFKDRIIGFDDDAHRHGIWNVPTFIVGEEKLAEQPYPVISKAVAEFLKTERSASVYPDLSFPDLYADRPYVVMDMVATIDGKTVSGDRNDTVADLGSRCDHLLLRRIEESVDAAMLGAQTLRATSRDWSPRTKKRVVVSRSGELPADAAFFQGEAYIATGRASQAEAVGGAQLLRSGDDAIDPGELLRQLKDLGVDRLLVLGGSELNGELLGADLADELFLTIAPKVKLGRDVPTYAGGIALGRDHLLRFRLVEHYAVENEVFLRYRRDRTAS